MANGIKFSQVGVDISRASDHEILFTSEWPSLRVAFNGDVSKTFNGTTDSGSVFYNHNLGFTPVFIPYVFDSAAGTYEIFRAILSVDKKNIYWYNPGGGGGGTGLVEYGIFIFPIDIEKNYVAPKLNPNPVSIGGTDQPYGMKFANNAKISSTDMQDFELNTNARAPLLHAVAFGPADSANNFSYTHTLPYNPMFLPFITRSGHPGQYFFISNFAGTATNGNTITLSDINSGGSASIVVLKDPFDVSENTIEVSI